MASLHLRKVPDSLREQLEKLARQDRRSLSAEAVTLLEEAVTERARRRESIAALKRISRRSRGHKVAPGEPDSVALIRESRGPLPERSAPE